MPSVDVDVTAIPDMIEAQLTLSYSRLSNLVRLIVDQGNGHDVDIDKLTNRINDLTKENAELRQLVESLISEKKGGDDDRAELSKLRQELSRVSDTCAENSRQISSAIDTSQQQNDRLNQRFSEEARVRANEMEHVQTSVKELKEFNRVTQSSMNLFDAFMALWECQGDKVQLLTKCDPDGLFQHSTDERVSYVHSLPVFTKVFDELDVLRQMMKQQASDALLAKSASSGKRATAIDTISSSAAASVDREAINVLQDSLATLEKRLRNLETRHSSALEEAPLQQPQPPPQQKGDTEYLPSIFSVQKPFSYQQRPSQPRPHSAASRRVPAPVADDTSTIRVEGEEAAVVPIVARPGTGVKGANSERKEQQMSDTAAPVGSRQGRRSSVEQSQVEVYRKPSATSPRLSNVPSQTQLHEPDESLQRRVAQLEENSSYLELKKADRRELAALEESLRQILQNTGMQLSPHLMSQYPGAGNDARMGYLTEAAHPGNTLAMQGNTPIGRPMFVGSASQYLRDVSGAITCATIATAQLQ